MRESSSSDPHVLEVLRSPGDGGFRGDGVVEDSVGGNSETTQAQQSGGPSKGVPTSTHHSWPVVASLTSHSQLVSQWTLL